MKKNTYIFKVNLFGPLLPQSEAFFRAYSEVVINELPSTWIEVQPPVSVNPSESMTGVSLSVDKKIYNGSVIYFTVKDSSYSIRIVSRKIEETLKRICSILSISVKGAKYYYKVLSASVINPEKGKEIEGFASEFLRSVSYKKLPLDDERKKFISEAGKLTETDKIVRKCFDFFENGLTSEILLSKVHHDVLLNYFKIIETISNYIAKKKKATKEEKKTKIATEIEEFIKSYEAEDDINTKIQLFRKCNNEIRKIEDNITKLKILKVAEILDIENQDELTSIIDTRNEQSPRLKSRGFMLDG